MKRSSNSGSSGSKKVTTINPHIDINNDDFTDSESIKFNMDLDNSNFISHPSTPSSIDGEGGVGCGGSGGGGGGDVTYVKSYGALDKPCYVDGASSSSLPGNVSFHHSHNSLPPHHHAHHHHHHHSNSNNNHLSNSSSTLSSSVSQYAHPIENYHNASQFGHRHFSQPSTFRQNGLYDDDHHLQPHPSSINSYSMPIDSLSKRAYVNVGFQDDERLSNNPTKRNPETISTHGRIMPSRDPVRWVDLETRYGKVPFKRQMSTTVHLTRNAGSCCSHNTLFNIFSSLFPILSWLKSYDVKHDLVNDVFAGLTAAALHLPQGMAYGLLAGVSPINGLYVSFFPVIIYALMGTSRHASVGTFAIASIMTRNTMNKLGVPPGTMSIGHGNRTINLDYLNHPTPLYTSLEVATALCFVAGAIRLVMGVFRLGIISILLSDQLVSAFSTGAAIHVATSQIADLFGWKSPKTVSGPFKLIYTWIDLFKAASTTNWVTTSLSIVCIVILSVYKEFIDEPMKKKFHLPVSVPIDLLILISSTSASYFIRMNVNYGVRIMGNIPKGLPSISTPNLDLSVKLLPDGFAVAMVTYAIGLSLGKIFAKKHRYQIRPSQELIALGAADLLSSFFSCYPCSASLSRTPVQENAGARTQLTALIASLIMLLILLFLGPLFFYLPKCVLSCIILVALKNMLIQIGDIRQIWSVSRLEGICYLITFLSTIVLDVDLGLIVGVLVAIIMALVRFMAPNVSLLGQLPNTEIYVEKNYFQQAVELDGIKIFRFSSALFFLNTETFRENLFKFCFDCAFFELMEADDSTRKLILGKTTAVIIDCSTISYVDSPGVEMILEIFNGLRDIRVRCYLASCPAILLSMLERTRFTEKITAKRSPIFPTIHDAVIAESLSIPL